MKSASELIAALAAALLLACGQAAPADTQAEQGPFHCAGCHTPEFVSTKRPAHAGVRPETCGVCHSQSSWGHARIEHPWWALTGAHARAAADKNPAGVEKRVKCFWCHRGEPAQFAGTPKACIGCHAEDRQGVKFSGHDGFSSECETCHSTEAWKPAQRPALPAPAPAPSSRAAAPAGKPEASQRPTLRSPPATKPTAKPALPQPVVPQATPRTPTPTPTPTATPQRTPTPDITTQASRRR